MKGGNATMRCPFCSEEILEGAAKCKHCGSDLSPEKKLPFPAIPGARPTSGVTYFLVALVVVVLALLVDPTGVLTTLIVVGTSIWAGFDASKHKLGRYQSGIPGPVGASLGSLVLWIAVFPWYLTVRSRIRAGAQPVKT